MANDGQEGFTMPNPGVFAAENIDQRSVFLYQQALVAHQEAANLKLIVDELRTQAQLASNERATSNTLLLEALQALRNSNSANQSCHIGVGTSVDRLYRLSVRGQIDCTVTGGHGQILTARDG
ncbi:hypothetical protein DFH06DRAFT_1148607 [Mycena polygramma]|nr:hypothetical protein DFH06DRAFT_1148607 [Mycena polygramma]